MRFPRSGLVSQMTGDNAPHTVVLEAPAGYGKSWLARKAALPDARWLASGNGERIPERCDERPLVIDDAHLLHADDIGRLTALIDGNGGGRLVVVGRLLSDEIHHAAQLADALILDTVNLAIRATRRGTDGRSRSAGGLIAFRARFSTSQTELSATGATTLDVPSVPHPSGV